MLILLFSNNIFEILILRMFIMVNFILQIRKDFFFFAFSLNRQTIINLFDFHINNFYKIN